MKILYIGGYGRSGSSIVSRLLAQQPGVASLGEVSRLGEYVRDGAACTCGEPVPNCPFWSRLNWADRNEAASFASQPDLGGFGRATGTEVAIDSSKTAYRQILDPAKYMRRRHELYLLHLVRRPDHVLKSARKGRNKDLERGHGAARRFETVRTLVGWLAANAVASLYRLALGKRAILVLYEEVLSNPEAVIDRVSALLEIDLSRAGEVVAKAEPLATGHEIAGNRVLRSDAEIFHKTKDAWPPAEGFGWKALSLVSALAGVRIAA